MVIRDNVVAGIVNEISAAPAPLAILRTSKCCHSGNSRAAASLGARPKKNPRFRVAIPHLERKRKRGNQAVYTPRAAPPTSMMNSHRFNAQCLPCFEKG
jgi:hypothetical protein